MPIALAVLNRLKGGGARRVGCVTNASVSSRCCTKDGSRPPEADLQEQASNRPVLPRSKGVVVNN